MFAFVWERTSVNVGQRICGRTQPRWRARPLLLVTAGLATLGFCGLAGASPARGNSSYDCQPQTQTGPLGRGLDDRPISFFGVYCEDRGSGAPSGDATQADVDGRSALVCGMDGGASYGSAHCFTNLTDQAIGAPLTFHVDFDLPIGTCDNDAAPSLVQGIEFSMSHYRRGLRWEWALQLENVGATAGDGAPQWRVWLPAAAIWQPLDIEVPRELCDGGGWHAFEMRGRVSTSGQVHFDSFSIDDELHDLSMLADRSPVAVDDEPDRFAAAVQLDANKTATPFAVALDQWSLDMPAATLPDTSIGPRPAAGSTIADRTPTIGFTASIPGSTFECRQDARPFAACSSPWTTLRFADGVHTVGVRAIDAAANVDATPATRRFVVDTTSPTTRIRKHPRRKIFAARGEVGVMFAFTGSDRRAPGATRKPVAFQCQIARAAFRTCRSPTTFRAHRGTNTFRVRAVDVAGNRDASPASFRFTVRTRDASARAARAALTARCRPRSGAERAIGVRLRPLAEPCAFKLDRHTDPQPARCPVSWVCQLDEGDGATAEPTVRLGVGQRVTVVEGTWRYVPAYPFADPVRHICRFLSLKASPREVYIRWRGQPRCHHRTRRHAY